MPHQSDEELLLLTKTHGNGPIGHKAFDTFVSRHRKIAVNFARSYVKDTATAEDMAQEGFIRLYENLPSYKPSGSARALLLKIIRNTCLNHLGRNKRHSRASERLRREQSQRSDISQQEEAIGAEESRRLYAALDSLTEKQRESVRLRYFANRSYSEIAATLGVTVSHVGVLLHKGLQKMRKVFAPGAVKKHDIKKKKNGKKERL